MVIINTRRDDLNGKAATVKRFDEALGRYICVLSGPGEKTDEIALLKTKLEVTSAKVEVEVDETETAAASGIPEQLRLEYSFAGPEKRKALLELWLAQTKITQEVHDTAMAKLV